MVAPAVLTILRERIFVWEDMRQMVRSGEIDFFFSPPQIEIALLPGKDSSREEAAMHLGWLRSTISHTDDEIVSDAERLKSVLWNYASEKGRGKVLWPLRYVLSGRERSPDPFTIASVIGKEETLRRIDAALAILSSA